LHSQNGETLDGHEFCRGTGCNQCNQTGYHGRIGIYEMIVMDNELAEALRTEDQNEFQRAALAQTGYKPLVRNAMQYACKGITTIEEVIRLCGWAE